MLDLSLLILALALVYGVCPGERCGVEFRVVRPLYIERYQYDSAIKPLCTGLWGSDGKYGLL